MRAIDGIEKRNPEENVHIPKTARSERDGYRSIDYRRENRFDERRKVFQVQEARAPQPRLSHAKPNPEQHEE